MKLGARNPRPTESPTYQFFLLGADHLPDLGLSVEDLMQSEVNLNCTNSMMADKLGIFYAKIRGEHWETGEVVKSKSKAVPKHLLRVSRT